MVLLPYVDKAAVSRDKIENYLLSFSHPQGRGKALLFTRLGFTRNRWEELRDALVEHAGWSLTCHPRHLVYCERH